MAFYELFIFSASPAVVLHLLRTFYTKEVLNFARKILSQDLLYKLKGVPQGSVFSVTLFTLYFSNILTVLPRL